jgi:leader peptidase (prepilin peptidase)/N-methyltransferase
MTDPAVVVLLSVFGLAVGSFLNVCIVRIPLGQSVVTPTSRCQSCGRSLRRFDNVPVFGWVALRGRCRACRAPISPVYLIVELVVPLLFLAQYSQVGWSALLVVRLIFISAMVVLFVIDLQDRILPNLITVPGIGVGLAVALVVEPGWPAAVLGVLIGGGGLLLIAEIYYWLRHEEGLGMGDIKMLAMIGAFLGWKQMLVTLLLASVLGSVVGIGMIVLGFGDSKYALPFGSFLALAAVVTIATGEPIVQWYGGGW